MTPGSKGYKRVSDFINELFANTQKLQEKYRFDRDSAFYLAVQCLKKIGGAIFDMNSPLVPLTLENGMAKLPNDIQLINGVYNTADCKTKGTPILYNASYSSKYISGDCCCSNNLQDDTFYINFPYLMCTVKSGNVLLDAVTITRDDKGEILYPDMVEVEEALRSYVMANLMYEGFLMEDIALNKYDYLMKEADEKIRLATNVLVMPDFNEAIPMVNRLQGRYNRFKLR